MAIDPRFHRLALLMGDETAEVIAKTKVIVVGLGGVGSWCAEALARSGVGSLVIIDSDTICISNINRQVQAETGTLGQSKAVVLSKRIKEINPACKVTAILETFSLRENFEKTASYFDIADADYVIDAIDTLNNKLDLIETASAMGKILFSSMGMACKLDPSLIRAADIWKTNACPLAQLVRRGLRERKFEGSFTAVYSAEKPLMKTIEKNTSVESSPGKKVLGSIVTVTATAGMMLASLVIRSVCSRFTENDP